jgi:hypothetical protein
MQDEPVGVVGAGGNVLVLEPLEERVGLRSIHVNLVKQRESDVELLDELLDLIVRARLLPTFKIYSIK